MARLLRSLQLSLRTKLLLPLVFVIAGLTGATLFVVRHSVETQAHAQIEQEARHRDTRPARRAEGEAELIDHAAERYPREDQRPGIPLLQLRPVQFENK